MAVHGISTSGDAIFGVSEKGRGVVGVATNVSAVEGNSTNGAGVFGKSEHEAGVRGVSTHGTGVVGIGRAFAAQFEGRVQIVGPLEVSGEISLSGGADYAEAFPTTDPSVRPGVVVVLEDDGEVHPCKLEYDTRVAGVVSGAGGVNPAIVLDRQENSANLALMGKVWCWADANLAAIRPGDLLTTPITEGHCRRVTEPVRAFGAVIGKALTPLAGGSGTCPRPC